jgi:mRNA interferase MazF
VVADPARGEVWWGEAPDAKGRPYLVLTRDEAIPVLRTVLVAPVTRTVRGIPSEVPLGAAQGLPADCAATMDNILAFPKSMLTRRMGAMAADAQWRMCDALAAATDC